jgi:benzoyl-CoA reductase/2-hydroxyglutaryl-CoA dehydratase subunit BcrC/BadD/HgdB
MFKKVDPKQSFPKMEEEILKFWDENKIFEVYMNEVWVTDALTVGREIYMSEIEEIMTELRKMDWNVVTPITINNNYASKLLQFESSKPCNATNVLKAVNMMQEAYKKYPVDGVIVQYHNERMSKVYNVPVYHIEIRMNDNNNVHMGEFLKDVCDISGGGHKNAAGGDLFSTTLDELFK